MIVDLKAGGNLFLTHLYSKHRYRCVERLCSEHNCTNMDAEDCFSESLLIARRAALQNKLENTNLGGYLYTLCYRVFLRKVRRKGVHQKAVNQLKAEMNDYDQELMQFEIDATSKQAKLLAAVAQLSDPCKRIIKSFYLDLIPLKDLQKKLGYKSYDTMKTTKKRCFEKLKGLMKKGGGNA